MLAKNFHFSYFSLTDTSKKLSQIEFFLDAEPLKLFLIWII